MALFGRVFHFFGRDFGTRAWHLSVLLLEMCYLKCFVIIRKLWDCWGIFLKKIHEKEEEECPFRKYFCHSQRLQAKKTVTKSFVLFDVVRMARSMCGICNVVSIIGW